MDFLPCHRRSAGPNRRHCIVVFAGTRGGLFFDVTLFGMRAGDVTLETPDTPDLAAWIVRSRADYIDERVAAGDTLAEATANADASTERTFPGGLPGPGQLVRRVMCAGERIGWLWVGPFGSDPRRWWVWDIAIEQELRGRGYGRKAMILAEELARANGATSLGLNVFAHNAGPELCTRRWVSRKRLSKCARHWTRPWKNLRALLPNENDGPTPDAISCADERDVPYRQSACARHVGPPTTAHAAVSFGRYSLQDKQRSGLRLSATGPHPRPRRTAKTGLRDRLGDRAHR
jgi:GNAT superfamily N-acetyltransferase